MPAGLRRSQTRCSRSSLHCGAESSPSCPTSSAPGQEEWPQSPTPCAGGRAFLVAHPRVGEGLKRLLVGRSRWGICPRRLFLFRTGCRMPRPGRGGVGCAWLVLSVVPRQPPGGQCVPDRTFLPTPHPPHLALVNNQNQKGKLSCTRRSNPP